MNTEQVTINTVLLRWVVKCLSGLLHLGRKVSVAYGFTVKLGTLKFSSLLLIMDLYIVYVLVQL